ncbi:YhcB family protein [Halomonas sp. LR3S48]|uniref:YhcB family protein n=1 Tax=Halomonadaceae TaxID=28256 RepID=UPI0021E41973|nr:YhcB family protein [Halomonas sp. LR3S48]UYG02274.1 YhcB family protein [Halomonas sp. LR3S48]
MDYGNVNWIVAIVSLLVGLGIGAIGYRALGASATRTQELRRQAAERERELNVLREGMNEHFSQVGMMVSNIQREMRTLEHRLTEDASTLHCDAPLNQQRTSANQLKSADRPALTGGDDDIPAPRDYADGSGGTLSEDFGLKPSEEKSETPQPPRY